MNTISCIAIDDEPLALSLIESYARKTPFLNLVGTFSSAAGAFSFLQETPVDLAFCDIQMPGLSGMELSRMLPVKTKVIFTTAFSQYALEGFKVHALGYLLKPISYEDFLSEANHALKVISPDKEPGQTSDLGRTRPQLSEDARTDARQEVHSIFVKTEYRLQQIDLDSITFIEGLKDYVKIHLDDGSDPVLSLMRMKNLEEKLPAGKFVRVQKSFIVPIRKIEAIERGHILIGKHRIPIGDTYQDGLYKALEDSSLLIK